MFSAASERNRERIVAADRAVFRRDGLDASMASVAREAGVGIATIFRPHGQGAWRRVVALFVRSFEAPAPGPLPDPPEHEAL